MGVYIPNMSKPKDGLYQIIHGKISQYKGNYGAIRVYDIIEIDLVKCEECEWSNGECSVGERYQGGCTFGKRRK